jgi:hypothetical protein
MMTRSHIIILGCCATLLAVILHACASKTGYQRPASPVPSSAPSTAPSVSASASTDPARQVLGLLPLSPADILSAVTEVQRYVASRSGLSSTVTVKHLRMLTGTSVICIVAVDQVDYAVTAVDADSSWQISDVESASAGNDGDQQP